MQISNVEKHRKNEKYSKIIVISMIRTKPQIILNLIRKFKVDKLLDSPRK
jgi:hypothetical protein